MKERLLKKQAAIKEDFETIQKEINQITQREQGLAARKAECNVEMFRLQGEHRAIEDLLKAEDPEVINKDETNV